MKIEINPGDRLYYKSKYGKGLIITVKEVIKRACYTEDLNYEVYTIKSTNNIQYSLEELYPIEKELNEVEKEKRKVFLNGLKEWSAQKRNRLLNLQNELQNNK